MDIRARQNVLNEYERKLKDLRVEITRDLQDITLDYKHDEIPEDEYIIRNFHTHKEYAQKHQELKDKYDIKDES